ncbi:hypothetical protein [Parvularcula dongshanensis]|uniref:Uncharacterized protein n=1 Tax=Parvularcula dongshanensis TaxID=1173995 RepID=A0A840I4X4_9PROT|nr:hypothetical protein [Parvularcula dongshanensis]MBB4660016.1 hypothetical protein [Parvularcula dongshanensis]
MTKIYLATISALALGLGGTALAQEADSASPTSQDERQVMDGQTGAEDTYDADQYDGAYYDDEYEDGMEAQGDANNDPGEPLTEGSMDEYDPDGTYYGTMTDDERSLDDEAESDLTTTPQPPQPEAE